MIFPEIFMVEKFPVQDFCYFSLKKAFIDTVDIMLIPSPPRACISTSEKKFAKNYTQTKIPKNVVIVPILLVFQYKYWLRLSYKSFKRLGFETNLYFCILTFCSNICSKEFIRGIR